MPRMFINVFMILVTAGALAAPAIAANPCSVSAQKHQLDLQKHAIDRQYPGPANAAYRESLKRQIDLQKQQLKLQKKQCETAYHQPKHKHHKDKDHDGDNR